MVSPSLLRTSARPNLYLCARCAFRERQGPGRATKRWLGQKYLAKVADAESEWQQRAIEIRSKKQKSMLSILEERGLIQQITGDRDLAEKRLTDRRLGAYVGIDPSASSLHVGHLLPLMALFWMYVHGYHTVTLLGGATAKIGDPTGRLTTRESELASTRTANMVSMHYQLKKLWMNVDSYGRRHKLLPPNYWAMHRELANNNHWWNKLPLLEFLQVLGPGMRLGPMLARDTVKNKLAKGDGMSFAEFTYPLMQAWDWWHMFRTKGIHMQIGGSDQYGNITAGIDAVKYISKHHPDPVAREQVEPLGEPFGFTTPLLTTSSGQKFGKSAGNAIWLDNENTSAFELYGHMLKTSDQDVGKYLKLFTFMPIEEIDTLIEQHNKEPSQRQAQHKLARELLELVHGVEIAKTTQQQHKLLFQKQPEKSQSPAILEMDQHEVAHEYTTLAGYITLNNRPKVNVQLPHSVVHKLSIGRILFACGLAQSATEGHRLAQQSAVFIGGMPMKEAMIDGFVSWTKIEPWKSEDTSKFLVHGDLLMFRRGKNFIKIIQVVPDEEYSKSGQTYPGQKLMYGSMNDLEKRSKKVLEDLRTPKGNVRGFDAD